MTTILPMGWNTLLKINSQTIVTTDNKDILYLKPITYFSDIQKWNQMMSMMICFVIFYHGWLDIFLRIVKKEKQAAPSVIDFCKNPFPRQKRFCETWVECYRILHGWPAVLHIFVCNPISPPRNGSLFSLKLYRAHLCFQSDMLSASLVSQVQM